MQRTRIRNCSLSEDATIERRFSEPVCGVRGKHQHYHQQENGYCTLKVHVEVRRRLFRLKMSRIILYYYNYLRPTDYLNDFKTKIYI